MRFTPIASLALTIVAAAGLTGCAVSRLDDIGQAPRLSPVGITPVNYGATMAPMSGVPEQPRQANTLWRPGSRSFFRDPRAAKAGDILTVAIEIGDEASLANTTTRTRGSSEDAGVTGLLGFESKLNDILPDSVDPGNLIGTSSDSNSTGTGTVNRSENINLTVAAVVVDVLPNGNLVIQGRQEVRVNFEVRELTISGIVRPEDISNGNTINHTQIAEARISYGGRGQITDVQQARYGQQIYDLMFPF